MNPLDILLYALSISVSIAFIAATVFVCAAIGRGLRKGLK